MKNWIQCSYSQINYISNDLLLQVFFRKHIAKKANNIYYVIVFMPLNVPSGFYCIWLRVVILGSTKVVKDLCQTQADVLNQVVDSYFVYLSVDNTTLIQVGKYENNEAKVCPRHSLLHLISNVLLYIGYFIIVYLLGYTFFVQTEYSCVECKI